ncbi:MAG: hypothetical protein Q8L66_16515 [Caulobacter sp.]|nr:hypothetical protein [Caulobacter sp.]
MTLSPIDAAFEGFRIIRDKPGLILVWTGFALVCLGLMITVLLVGVLPRLAHLGPAPMVAEGGVRELADLTRRFGATAVLLVPIALVMSTMLTSAVFRVVLRPEERRGAHLRFGADELRLIAVNLIVMVCFSIIAAIYGVAIMQASHLVGAGGNLVTTLGLAGGAVLVVWAGIRLSLAPAMTFADRRIRLIGAWTFTHGHFWRLAGMWLMTLVFSFLIAVFSAAVALLVLKLFGGLDRIGQIEAGGLTPTAAVAALAFVAIQLSLQMLQLVLLAVTAYAPPAAAYRSLKAPGR